jgi:hypothetical protein
MMAVLYVSQAVVPATNLFWQVLMLTYGALWTSGGTQGRGDKRCRITAQRTRDLAVSASLLEVTGAGLSSELFEIWCVQESCIAMGVRCAVFTLESQLICTCPEHPTSGVFYSSLNACK